jgi:hypothetical protein
MDRMDRIVIDDVENIDLELLQKVVLSLGWENVPYYRTDCNQYLKDSRQILIPSDKDVPDFTNRITQSIQMIALLNELSFNIKFKRSSRAYLLLENINTQLTQYLK